MSIQRFILLLTWEDTYPTHHVAFKTPIIYERKRMGMRCLTLLRLATKVYQCHIYGLVRRHGTGKQQTYHLHIKIHVITTIQVNKSISASSGILTTWIYYETGGLCSWMKPTCGFFLFWLNWGFFAFPFPEKPCGLIRIFFLPSRTRAFLVLQQAISLGRTETFWGIHEHPLTIDKNAPRLVPEHLNLLTAYCMRDEDHQFSDQN